MTRTLIGTICLAAAALAAPALAQQGEPPKMTPEQQAEMEAYMKAATPGAPHHDLAQAVGTYAMTVKTWQAPGAPPTVEASTATRTMMMDRILVEDVTGTMMGSPFIGHGMTGYDNVSGKYWSTWNDNMMTGVIVSEGTCDAQHACTFIGTMNDPIKKAAVKMRMTSKRTGPTTEVFEMYMPGPDGKEMKGMEITYTKK